MASGIYNRFKANLMNKVVDLEADTIKVALLNGSHAFTATNTVWTDVSANEITNTSGTAYTAGGVTLTGLTVTEGATTIWTASSVSWTTATFTANHAVIYDITATSNLVLSIDFGGAKTATAGTFTINWNVNGIINLV